ncbi:phosphate ABC transporter permease subunit PstC [Faunimonas sp. B44]|uniref:phosphate ABC transporter permease subunit PstC n=1 Tax=Faunimonas sp. B44 TaxID=3461493 RepID=UPI00404465D1
MTGYLFLAILLLSVTAYVVGRREAYVFGGRSAQKLHSRPIYHGFFVAIWVGIPAIILVLVWLLFQNAIIDRLLLASLPSSLTDGASPAQLRLFLSEIKNAAGGRTFGNPSPEILAAAETLVRWREIARWAMVVAVACLTIVGLLVARSRLSPTFRARHGVEHVLTWLMVFCSVVAILTTTGIVASLLFEAWQFFGMVPIAEFLFGLRWEPQISIRADQIAGAGAFGVVPVLTGTFLIALMAMMVAVPIGLLSAIYLVEYADKRVRTVVKPVLEMLAGIPTVVYGFFAVLTVAPALRRFMASIGVDMAPNSALVAGGVMGIMLIPFISSLADDALTAVPRTMRDGSLAMGATPAETISRVLIPAALPGIMGGVLLALSRAVGETMIVVMAAGLIATLTFNPLDSVTTVTVQIVTLLIGDTEFDSPKTLAAFALGLLLFLITLSLNVIALRIVQKYRERYE